MLRFFKNAFAGAKKSAVEEPSMSLKGLHLLAFSG